MNFDTENGFFNFVKTLVFFTLVGLLYRTAFSLYHFSNWADLDISSLVYALGLGIRFDLVAASYFALLYSIGSFIFTKSPKSKKILFSILFFALSGILASDLMYFSESSRHLGYEINELGQSGLGALFMAWTQHTTFMIFHSLFQIFVIYGILTNKNFLAKSLNFSPRAFLFRFLILVVFIVTSRGGLQMIPIKPEFAYQAGNNHMATISLNGAFSALYESIHSRDLKPLSLPFPDNGESFQNLYSESKNSEVSTKISKRNIVVVLLEGWSLKYLSSYNGPTGNTPFLDSYIKSGLSTEVMLADGHRTTEGIFSSFCSYPNPLGKSVAQSQLQNFNYNCLPKILKKLGWETSFIQGSLKETSGTGSFAQSIGFNKSYGKEDISQNKWGKNYWGKHDGDIYDFALEKMALAKKPFFIGINTNTTHDNVFPSNWEPKLSKNDESLVRADLINYADDMLGKFVAKTQKKFPDSLFVVLSDHTSHVGGDIFGEYAIPFVIFGKGVSPKLVDSISSQKDLAPTVSSLLGLDYGLTKHFTGIDLTKSKQSFALIYHQGSFGFSQGKHFSSISFSSDIPNQKNYLWDSTSKKLIENKNSEPKLQLESFFSFIHTTQKLLFSGKTTEFEKTSPQYIEKKKRAL